MAISETVITTTFGSGGSKTTASFTRTVGRVYVIAVLVESGSATPASASGWSQKALSGLDPIRNLLCITLLTMAGDGVTASVTVSFPSGFANIQVIEFASVDATTPVPQGNGTAEFVSPVDPTTSLSAFSDATNNATFVAASYYTSPSNLSASGGYTTVSSATGDLPFLSAWKLGQDLAPGVAASHPPYDGWVCCALEIKAAASAFTLTVANASIALANGAPALVQANALVVAGQSLALSIGAVSLTQANRLTIANAALGMTIGAPVLLQANVLALANASLGLSLGSVTLTQANVLAVANALVALAEDSPAMTQANTLAIANSVIALSLNGVALTQANVLAVANAMVALSVGAPALVQANVLATADTIVALAIQAPTLSQANGLAVFDSLVTLAVQNPTLLIPILTSLVWLIRTSRPSVLLARFGSAVLTVTRLSRPAVLLSRRLDGTMPETTLEVALGNDHLIDYDATEPNPANRKEQPAAGRSLTAWLSATDGGAAIHADVSISLTERSGLPGAYFGVIPGAATLAHLTEGQTVYEVITEGSAVRSSLGIPVVAASRPSTP